jgi:glycosyltransferase involved in cell wall biosynthesis
MRVLAFAPYPESGASTRYRLLQFAPALARDGIELVTDALHTEGAFRRMYSGGGLAVKAADWLAAGVRRFGAIQKADQFDVVIVHRELWPMRGLLHEHALLARNARWVFDLDDAMFLPHVSEENRRLAALKAPGKSRWVLAHSRAVAAGNRFLLEWADSGLSPGARAFLVPTALDVARWRPAPARHAGEGIALGWIGTHTTARYLDALLPVFAELKARHPGLRLVTIGGRFEPPGWQVEYRPWSLAGEVDALQGIDIGISPLPDTDWARGKCGLKLLQYMAVGVPAVASRVGAHLEIAPKGEGALLASGAAEWVDAISGLARDEEARKALGERGRRTVVERYSIEAVAPVLREALVHAKDATSR